MSNKKTLIPNPNKISERELEFINDGSNTIFNNVKNEVVPVQERYKGRMISMSDSFWSTLNDYLKKNPTEGNKSSFIVRVVAEYIKDKNKY